MPKLGVALLLAFPLALTSQTPIRLIPGQAITLKRSDSETFALTAKAGQTLLAELNTEFPYSSDDRIEVTASSDELLPSALGEDTRDNWINQVQKTGPYRVAVVHTAPQPYVLRLTLLDPQDPRLDLGIRPEQISILDPQREIRWRPEAFFPVAPELGEFGPARLVGEGGKLRITIQSVEGIKKTWWIGDKGARSVASLQGAMKSSPAISPKEFPGALTAFADLTFVARKQVLSSPSLHAVRWLGAYDQMDLSPVNPLTYAAEAITADGRFFVTVRGVVNHPAVPDDVLNLLGARLQDFRAQLARRLNIVPADSFDPSLSRIDEVVQSLTIR